MRPGRALHPGGPRVLPPSAHARTRHPSWVRGLGGSAPGCSNVRDLFLKSASAPCLREVILLWFANSDLFLFRGNSSIGNWGGSGLGDLLKSFASRFCTLLIIRSFFCSLLILYLDKHILNPEKIRNHGFVNSLHRSSEVKYYLNSLKTLHFLVRFNKGNKLTLCLV